MSPTTESAAASLSRSVNRVCDILDALADSEGPVSLSEVATATSLPKSSAFRYLAALEARHYAERDADTAGYRLGPAFRPKDTRAVERLVELAAPVLQQLRDLTGETVNLGLLDGSMIVHRVVVESPQSMRLAARVGDRGYVHATALGKVLCAKLPEDRIRAILRAAGMPSFTPATITDEDDYFAELERVREQGYAVDAQENQQEGRCVAVAIPRLPLLAGISVSAPATRLSPEDVPAVVRRLTKAAAGLGKKLSL